MRGVSNQSCKSAAGAGRRESASRGTVLVVDDEPAVAELLCNMMERKGFQVEIVLEPRQAVSRARACRRVLSCFNAESLRALPGAVNHERPVAPLQHEHQLRARNRVGRRARPFGPSGRTDSAA